MEVKTPKIRKGYKQTEVGVIPEDWDVKRVTDVADVIGGGTPPTAISEYWNGSINWFTPTEIGLTKYVYKSKRKLTESGLENSSAQILNKGTVLLTSRAGIGNMAILKTRACTNQGFQSLIPYITTSNEYLYYLIQTKKKSLLEKASGSTFLEISPNNLRSILIQTPKLPEQKAIATALSDIDELIQSLDTLIEKKKNIKTATMQQLLTGKKRLPGFEKNTGMKKTSLGMIPNDWDVKPLPDVVNYIHGKAHEQYIVEYGKYDVVNSKYVASQGGVKKYTDKSFLLAEKDDLLTVLSDLPNGKALAKCFYVDTDNKYAVNQRVCIWRSKKDSPKYLYYILNRNDYFLKLNDGVSQTHILNHHIEKCPLLIPSDTKEQEAIAKIISEIEAEIKMLDTKLHKYISIKQGMMHELLTGNIRLV